MHFARFVLVMLVGVATLNDVSAQSSGEVTPPRAKQVPKSLTLHGVTRIDPYYWLNERDNPQVISYLEAENAYAKQIMAHTEPLQAKLFEEIKGRIKQTDISVPYRRQDYLYYSRTEEGKDYPIYCRKRTEDDPEQIILNVNDLAEGHEYCSVRGQAVSESQQLLAFAVDFQGRRIYEIRIKDLSTGKLLEDRIPNVTGNVVWANDNKTLFYSRQDAETLRSHQIFRHTLGTPAEQDVLVFEETDDTFSTFVFKSRSKKFILIGCSQTLSNEYRYLSADQPSGEFQVFLKRERDHEYSLDHFDDQFLVLTNREAPNFKLMSCDEDQTDPSQWRERIAHRADVLLESFEAFRDFLVLEERSQGLTKLRIMRWNGDEDHYLDFGEPAYSASLSANPEADTTMLRYAYSSMTTPNSVFDYHMVERQKTLLKEAEVLGDFDKTRYKTERLLVEARDGAKVPVSVVYRKDQYQPGHNPILVYGYGSYGASMDASFSSPRLSLLDRGFVFAIAHIRGGQEMGRAWYEDGKLFKKKNTFTDFIDVTKHLIENKYADPKRVYAQGGSAGGLLVGAVMNMQPELYHGILAAVPFVDVVTTMLDDSIPLTTSEYDEWGNPNEVGYFRYMLSYSPYDNVEAKAYPNLMVTTGLHDSQVQYWEPAKWVAKLRDLKTDKNRLIMITEMSAGHGGPSGRYERYRKTAEQYAFLLDLAGRADK